MAEEQEDLDILFQRIIFQECDKLQEIRKLKKKSQIKQLKDALAQKIAYEAIFKPARPPKEHHDDDRQYHPPTIFGSLCCCLYPEQNKQAFLITSYLFKLKLVRALMFWRDDFLLIRDQSLGNRNADNNNNEVLVEAADDQHESQPDMYGPLWLSITYIIIVALSGNINNYFSISNKSEFQFNSEYLLRILGLHIIFGLSETMILPSVVSCQQGHVTSEQSTNLFGYSLLLYYIPTMLCIFPSETWHIIMLVIAEVTKAIFLGRNFSSRVDSKKYLIFIPILIFAFLHYYLVYSIFFSKMAGPAIQTGFDAVLHARAYSA